jgi:hypothetical protein
LLIVQGQQQIKNEKKKKRHIFEFENIKNATKAKNRGFLHIMKRLSGESPSRRSKASRTEPSSGFPPSLALPLSYLVSAQTCGQSVDSEIRVKRSSTEMHTSDKKPRGRKICKRAVVFPELILKRSLIPKGGKGVFAEEHIKCGQWVTEYGGEIICNEIAGKRRTDGEDTHIRSAGFMDQCIDSRARGKWSFDYYTR